MIWPNLFIWTFPIVVSFGLVIFSAILFAIKKIKKDNNYLFFKKALIVLAELLILFLLVQFSWQYIEPVFVQSKEQIKNMYKKLNTLNIGKEVSQTEVDSIKLLFKDDTPSKIYADMRKVQKGFQTPQGSPIARQKNLLQIEKLDKECHYEGEKSKLFYFENCTDGDLYVKYGWDACFPNQLDCVGENYFENYLIRSVNGEYKIIEVY